MAERPSWQDYFMDVAKTAARRSTCLRKSVGAVIVSPHSLRTPQTVVSMGYNGSVRGQPSCSEVGCYIENHVDDDGKAQPHCVRSVHAEQNALIHARSSVRGCHVYVTAYPCWMCARALYQAGIEKIFYAEFYGGKVHPLLQQLLDSGALDIRQVEST